LGRTSEVWWLDDFALSRLIFFGRIKQGDKTMKCCVPSKLSDETIKYCAPRLRPVKNLAYGDCYSGHSYGATQGTCSWGGGGR
jgi:hypothetical protein